MTNELAMIIMIAAQMGSVMGAPVHPIDLRKMVALAIVAQVRAQRLIASLLKFH